VVSRELIKKIAGIKVVATDIDGVWTDGKMYYSADGEFMKAFSTYDGFGANLLEQAGFPVIILTGENSMPVKSRMEKLGLKHVYLGVKDKLSLAREICKKFNVNLSEVAYIGDDLNDLELLANVGFSAMVPNSPVLSQFKPDYQIKRFGGNGAFREFADLILKYNKK